TGPALADWMASACVARDSKSWLDSLGAALSFAPLPVFLPASASTPILGVARCPSLPLGVDLGSSAVAAATTGELAAAMTGALAAAAGSFGASRRAARSW